MLLGQDSTDSRGHTPRGNVAPHQPRPGGTEPRGTQVVSTPTHRERRVAAGDRTSRKAGIVSLTIFSVVLVIAVWLVFQRDDEPFAKLQPAPSSVTQTVISTDTSLVVPIESPKEAPGVNRLALDEVIQAIVAIDVSCPEGDWSGSGTIVLDGTFVITNHHVAPQSDCRYVVCFTESWTEEPNCDAYGDLIDSDVENDLSVLRLKDAGGSPYRSDRQPIKITGKTVRINEEIYLVGYPGFGGNTITSVSGVVSGLTNIPAGESVLQGEFIKTDAQSGPGVSGGAAFNALGEYIGTPTGGRVDAEEGTSLGFVRPARFAEALLLRVRRGVE